MLKMLTYYRRRRPVIPYVKVAAVPRAWRTPRRAEAAARTQKRVEERLYVRSGGVINKKPSPASLHRLPSHRFFMGRLGRGVWRMGLGVLSRPAGCWSWLRPRGVSAPHGTVPVSCWRWLRPPMWGDRDRPQQGGCLEKVRQPLCIGWSWLRMYGG
jgi:hypothetical protein